MRNFFFYAITSYEEFRTSGIRTDRNLTEINCNSVKPELRLNLMEFLTEMLNGNA